MKPEEKSIRVLAEHLTVLPIKIHSQVLFASDFVKLFDEIQRFNFERCGLSELLKLFNAHYNCK